MWFLIEKHAFLYGAIDMGNAQWLCNAVTNYCKFIGYIQELNFGL